MTMFAWTKETAITFTSIAQGLFGVMTIALYFCYSYFTLDKRLTYRVMLVSGLVAYLCFHILTFSWPFTPGHLLSFDGTALVNGSTELRGCDVKKFDWCKTQNPVNEWLYNVSYVLTIGFGFPIINLTLMTLFSKILGPRRQGTHQGVLQMSGSIARVIGPIAMSWLYTVQGPRLAWGIQIVVSAATILLWIVYYRRMMPMQAGGVPQPVVSSPSPSPTAVSSIDGTSLASVTISSNESKDSSRL